MSVGGLLVSGRLRLGMITAQFTLHRPRAHAVPVRLTAVGFLGDAPLVAPPGQDEIDLSLNLTDASSRTFPRLGRGPSSIQKVHQIRTEATRTDTGAYTPPVEQVLHRTYSKVGSVAR
ncbi:hypothetical protein C8Q77DRAFT_70513 [Trametes polyzona]|nr:hypothetical protein C8Q77DRAFT_70513 [Trametes polyzona]